MAVRAREPAKHERDSVDRLLAVLGDQPTDPPEPPAEERLSAAAKKIEARRAQTPPRVYFRTPRGGHVPLDERSRRELLQLYSGFGISVADIAEHFGVGTGTVYRWLILLGVQSQDRATPDELRRMAEARALARQKQRKR